MLLLLVVVPQHRDPYHGRADEPVVRGRGLRCRGAGPLQGGWAGQLIGIDNETPMPAFIPVLMFAVLFGLSMDYEVFLVSRMRESWLRHGDNSRAIVDGLAGTGRVITAAAAIMVAVFAAFIPSPEVFLKVIGVGMAAAIFVDATVVRMLLVPAVMHLLGRANWWLPAWWSGGCRSCTSRGGRRCSCRDRRLSRPSRCGPRAAAAGVRRRQEGERRPARMIRASLRQSPPLAIAPDRPHISACTSCAVTSGRRPPSSRARSSRSARRRSS